MKVHIIFIYYLPVNSDNYTGQGHIYTKSIKKDLGKQGKWPGTQRKGAPKS